MKERRRLGKQGEKQLTGDQRRKTARTTNTQRGAAGTRWGPCVENMTCVKEEKGTKGLPTSDLRHEHLRA